MSTVGSDTVYTVQVTMPTVGSDTVYSANYNRLTVGIDSLMITHNLSHQWLDIHLGTEDSATSGILSNRDRW